MPDIAMCKDKTCPTRQSCYRYRAQPNGHWQSYFSESPRNYFKSCDEFLTIYTNTPLRTLEECDQ